MKTWAAGEAVNASDLNQNFVEASKLQDVVKAGATINGATVPVPVYQKISDLEWYPCDADDIAECAFKGFAISNGTDGNDITVQFNGIVSGLSGLTKGEKYFVQDDGSLGITPGTNIVPVGIALSTTTLLIIHEDIIVKGTIAGVSDSVGSSATENTDEEFILNAKPKAVKIYGNVTVGAWGKTDYSNGWFMRYAKTGFYFGAIEHYLSTESEKYGFNFDAEQLQASHIDSNIGATATFTVYAIEIDGFTVRLSAVGASSGGGNYTLSNATWMAIL